MDQFSSKKNKTKKETKTQEVLEDQHTSNIEEIPEEVKKVIQMGFSMQRFSGPVPPQFIEKLNEEHITKIINSSENDDERAFKLEKAAKLYTFCYVLIASALFVFITLFLVTKDSSIYNEVIKIIAIFIGGLGSGYGLKTWTDKKK